MSEHIYNLTEYEWQTHFRHRRLCTDRLCDHPAHHYGKAFADGRVRVDGVPVGPDGSPLRPSSR